MKIHFNLKKKCIQGVFFLLSLHNCTFWFCSFTIKAMGTHCFDNFIGVELVLLLPEYFLNTCICTSIQSTAVWGLRPPLQVSIFCNTLFCLKVEPLLSQRLFREEKKKQLMLTLCSTVVQTCCLWQMIKQPMKAARPRLLDSTYQPSSWRQWYLDGMWKYWLFSLMYPNTVVEALDHFPPIKGAWGGGQSFVRCIPRMWLWARSFWICFGGRRSLQQSPIMLLITKERYPSHIFAPKPESFVYKYLPIPSLELILRNASQWGGPSDC